MNKQQYKDYLKTSHWRMFRERVLLRVFVSGCYKCESCGELCRRSELDVHHLHYKTIGRERPTDVKVLCHDCHADEHDIEPFNRVRITGKKQNPFAEIMALAYEKLKPIHKRMIDGVITQERFNAIKREYIDLLLKQKKR